MKQFNLTGLCIPGRHYMVDMTERVDRIIKDYIDQGAYFTINRARQFGKTTMLLAIQQRLSDQYLVIRLSFEAADDYFKDQQIFANGIVMDVAEELERSGVDSATVEVWGRRIESEYPMRVLSRRISDLCRRSDKKIVLMVDEADRCSDNQIFLNFLGMLRNKYLDMQQQRDLSFQSVILTGVYDIKNLKLKLRPDEEQRYNSPWNIAKDFDVDMSFSVDDIMGMLREYSAETCVSMDTAKVSERICFYTGGYPFLVSWLCKWIDEKGGKEWTVQNVDRAEKALLSSDNTLFDDMIKNTENNKTLKRVVVSVLLEGEWIPFTKTNQGISLGVMFGILTERNGTAAVANIVFETVLYNHMIVERILRTDALGHETNQFVHNGQLDTKRPKSQCMRLRYKAGDINKTHTRQVHYGENDIRNDGRF